MSAFWVSPHTFRGKFAGATHISDNNSGPIFLDEVRFWVASPAFHGKFSGVTHFWDSNSGPEKMVEVRFLGRTTCIPKQNRRVPRSSRFCPVARKTAPLGSYGHFKFLTISCQPVTDSALRLAPISLRTVIRARTRPNMITTAPRHRRHRENIGDLHYPQRLRGAGQGLPRQHANIRTHPHRHH